MSKSILVIDTPKACADCPCHFTRNYGITVCTITDESIFKGEYENLKPDWCPLWDLPERANHPYYFDNGRYDKGWNDCIDEILKGGESNETG